jgi:prepilin-type N-terminal cleavage/methylation domain-containing protein
MASRRKKRGVTLLELLIALSISGFAILGGVMLLDQLTDSGARIVASRMADARAGNGDRLFRRLLSDARASVDSTQRFIGDEHNASYLTVCDVPSGWPETCRATFTIDSLRDSSVVAAEVNGEGHFTLRRFAGTAHFRYLDLAARDSVWVRRWATSISLPTAIAIVTSVDTLVFALGSARD